MPMIAYYSRLLLKSHWQIYSKFDYIYYELKIQSKWTLKMNSDLLIFVHLSVLLPMFHS
jgi:hypothetical protein